MKLMALTNDQKVLSFTSGGTVVSSPEGTHLHPYDGTTPIKCCVHGATQAHGEEGWLRFREGCSGDTAYYCMRCIMDHLDKSIGRMS